MFSSLSSPRHLRLPGGHNGPDQLDLHYLDVKLCLFFATKFLGDRTYSTRLNAILPPENTRRVSQTIFGL